MAIFLLKERSKKYQRCFYRFCYSFLVELFKLYVCCLVRVPNSLKTKTESAKVKRAKYFEAHQVGRLSGHNDCVYTIVQGKEPHIIFSAAGDGMVAVWNLQDLAHGQSMAQVPASVYALHYLAETDTLLVAQNFEGIYAVQVAEKKVIKALKLTNAAIFDIQSDEKNSWIACGDGMVIVLNRNYEVVAQLRLSEKSARTIAFHPTLPQVAIGYSDHYIRIIDTRNFQLLVAWKAHENSVFSLQYINENQLLSAGRDAYLRLWNVPENYEQNKAIPAHLYTINHIAVSPDEQFVATAGLDKSIKIWRASDLKLLKVIDKARHAGHGTSINKLVWTSYHNWIVACSDDRSISVWELNSIQ
jgi:WD40 repeat protein